MMKQTIPFVDLTVQARALEPALLVELSAVLRSGTYVLGEPVERFERAFAAHCGITHAIAVSSGTAALHLSLLAAGVAPGDEVITVPMTFVATVAAILYAGATPRLVDIDPVRGTMDPGALAAAITPRTRAIIPVHLHGRMADMAPILAIAQAHGIAVIEDAAQAHDAYYAGQHAGTLGTLGCFSFYPAKNLGACGEGGAIITNDAALAVQLRMLRDWGQEQRYLHTLRGYNYRMDAIQGAILGVKLPHLCAWTDARRQLARQYSDRLQETGLRIPQSSPPREHACHVYAVRVSDRDRLCQTLADAGIATGVHYPLPVHLEPAYADLGYGPGDFPESEAFAAETLSLPLYPELQTEQLDRVCDVLQHAMRGCHAVIA